jgi:predicted lipoprotein with Yx(FWY)xxD motif
MKTLKNKLVYGSLAMIALFLVSCSDNDDYSTGTTDIDTANVRLASDAAFGSILVDGNGNSLYFFSRDTKTTSECTDGCLNNWPVFYNADISVGTGLEASDFGTITRGDGSRQTTYKGWPLYYFANDNVAGDTNGDGVGGVWFIAKPDYSVMYANAQLIGNDGNNYLEDYTLGDGSTSYIVSVMGRTMYTFVNDRNGVNNFTAQDFSNNGVWPIVEISLDEIPSVLNNGDFGTIDVFGRSQLTYKGWPLYYFGQDTSRGDNKGISVPNPGVWPIANLNTVVAQN